MSAIEIPGYKIVRTLGVGGQATVYLAIQQGFDREVALKIMSPALAADPSFGERFIREAKIVAKLSHKSIVTVYDAGESGNFYYLAMEFMPGEDLKTKIAQGMKTKECLSVIRKLAKALHFAHEKGYIHRDVKSENILFNTDGEPVLTDFGIAKASNSSTQMTQTGKLIGTPEYMSPEQCRGKTVDGRSDLYSLGVIFYEMLTRRVPYTGEDSVSVCIKHVTKPLPQLPARLTHYQWLIDSLLAKDPVKRFQTGLELATAIVEFEASGTPRKAIHKLKSTVTSKTSIRNTEIKAIDSETHDSDDFDDLYTENRFNTIEEGSKSIVSKLAFGIVIVVLGITGFVTKERWVEPGYQWVKQAFVNSNKEEDSAIKNQELLTDSSQNSKLKAKSADLSIENNAAIQRNSKSAKPSPKDLLLEADALVQFQPQKIDDIKKALKLLAAVNTLEPDNKNAYSIYQNILSTSLVEATKAAENNNFQAADEWVALVEFENSTYPLLEATKAGISRSKINFGSVEKDRNEVGTKIQELLESGDLALKENRLSAPSGNNAIEFFQQILELQPENVEAKNRMSLATEAYVTLVEQAIAEKAFSKAKTLLSRFNSLSDDQSTKMLLRQKIAQSEKEHAIEIEQRREQTVRKEQLRIVEKERETRLNDPMIKMQLLGSLDSARTLESQGALVMPEFDNAVAKYQAVLNLDDRNTEATQGLQRIEDKIKSKLTENISVSNKDEANLWLTKLKLLNSAHPDYEQFRDLVEQILEPVENQTQLHEPDLQPSEVMGQQLINGSELVADPASSQIDELNLESQIGQIEKGVVPVETQLDSIPENNENTDPVADDLSEQKEDAKIEDTKVEDK